jgi:hypothetical protein
MAIRPIPYRGLGRLTRDLNRLMADLGTLPEEVIADEAASIRDLDPYRHRGIVLALRRVENLIRETRQIATHPEEVQR